MALACSASSRAARLIAIAIALLGFISCASYAQPKDVCFLTDMSSDVDDFGALQLLAYFEKQGKVRIRCVITSSSTSRGYMTVRHLLDWWGVDRDNYRIGTDKRGGGDAWSDDALWVSPYISKYKLTPFATDDGSDLIVEMLKKHPMMHVIEAGPPSTAYNALAMGRIKNYHQMGGEYPSGAEYNLKMHPRASMYIDDFNVEWYDHHLGKAICTGSSSAFARPTPVEYAYRERTEGRCRSSWDLVAALGAIEPEWFSFKSGGFVVMANGSNTFSASKKGRVAFARSAPKIRDYLNGILSTTPNEVADNRASYGAFPFAAIYLLLLDD